MYQAIVFLPLLGAILAGVFHGTGGAMLSFAVLAGITGISALVVYRFAEG